MELVDLVELADLVDQEELVVLVEQEVMVDPAAVAVAAVLVASPTVKVLMITRPLGVEVVLVFLAGPAARASSLIRVDLEQQTLAAGVVLRTLVGLDSVVAEET